MDAELKAAALRRWQLFHRVEHMLGQSPSEEELTEVANGIEIEWSPMRTIHDVL
jgi:hypothetical protein